MDGGTEVGRISIRVVPDLDRFREELEAELAKYENKVLEIKAKLDTSGIRREAEAATKNLPDAEINATLDTAGAKAQAEAFSEGLDDAEIDLTTNIDRLRQRYLSKFNSLMSEVDANIPLTFDGEELRSQYKAFESSFKNQLKLFDPKADEDTLTQLRQDVDSFFQFVRNSAYDEGLLNKQRAAVTKGSLKRIQDLISFQVDLDFAMAELELAAFKAKQGQDELELLLRPKVITGNFKSDIAVLQGRLREKLRIPVDVDWDRNRLTRSLAGIGKGIRKASEIGVTAGTGLAAVATGAMKAATSLLRMGDAFWIVAGVVAVAAPALSLLAGSLVALPGLLTAVAVPIAAVALGVDGIKKAAEAAKPAFDKLKQTMSDTFQAGMTPAFQKLADDLFPRLQAALPKVATSLSNLFDTFTNTITTPENLNKVEGTINAIARALDRAKPGVAAFTNGFSSLVNATAGPMLQSLVNTLNQLGTEFDAWVNKVTANGKLQQAMDTLKATFGEIGGILKDITSYSFDQLADPAFGEKMKTFVQDVRSLVNDVLPLLKSGFEDVATIIDGIVTAIDKIKGAASWFEKLTGAEAPKVDGPKQTEGLFGLFGKDGVLGDNAPFRKLFGDVPAEAEKAGAAAGKGLNTGMEAGLEQTKKNVEEALKVEKPQTVKVGGLEQDTGGVGMAVSGEVDTAITAARNKLIAFQGEFANLIAQTLLPLQQIPSQLNTTFAGLGAAFVGAFTALQGIVAEQVNGIVTTIATGFETIPARLTLSFAALGGAVGGAMAAVKNVIAAEAANVGNSFATAFAGAAARVREAMSGVVQAVQAAMAQAAAATASGAAAILGAMQAGLAAVTPVVEQSFAAVPAVITAKMAEANAAVAAGGQQMVATALSFAGAMRSAGVAVGAGFAEGIASQTGTVAAAASSLMAAARSFFPNSPADEGPFSGSGWVDKSGVALAEGFAGGIKTGSGTLITTVRELMQAVKDVFGSAEGLTLNFNLGGVTEQTQRATAAVTDFGTAMSNVPLKQLDALQTPGLLNAPVDSKQQKEELQRQLALLEMERKTLELQKGQAGANDAAVKARLEEIRQQKLQLGLQQDQLNYAMKYGDQVGANSSQTDQAYKDLTQKALEMPLDFMKATRQQFLNDIGISGGGALGAIMDYGLDFGSKFIFNVSNIQEAMAVQANQVAKQGMGMVGR